MPNLPQDHKRPCVKCRTKYDREDYSPSRQRRHHWLCKVCERANLDAIPKDPEVRAAHRIHSRGLSRGALQVGCRSKDFRGIAAHIVAKRKAHPEIEWHIDHIVPVAQGGCGCPANLQVLSREQHLAKTAREFKLPAE